MGHPSIQAVRKFQYGVYKHYRASGRRFPWRDTRDPYRILVSEVMLQQTQAERVVPFYTSFVERFRSVIALANAGTGEVVRLWQGLGYNRRALNLQRAARIIVDKYGGVVPKNLGELDALPGIGKYTAAAVLAFAFNEPSVFVETNIRTACLHYFLKRKKKVGDLEILSLVKQTVDKKKPREWYYALMDYGAMLKRTVGNENVRSKHYAKQSRFKGSKRELRGGIIKLATEKKLTEDILSRFSKEFNVSMGKVKGVADTLVSEGFLSKIRGSYLLQ